MSRTYFKELRDGDAVDEVFLLADKQLRANRNANLYLLATLRDRTGMMSGLMWNVTEDSMAHISAGMYVRVCGKVQLYQGGLQMIVTHVSPVPAEQVDPDEFHPDTTRDVQPLLNRLRETLLSVENPSLRQLMECFLADDELMDEFAAAPAGIKAHHAYPGGLLEHVVNMLEVSVRIGELYPSLDQDLLIVGVFLHDFGKVRELEYKTAMAYTDEGQLLGHMHIAIEILNDKVAKLALSSGETIPDELLLRIKHMILSHHGSYAFGSSRLPMTPEAIALHHIDNLDAKVHEFAGAIDQDPIADSHWTPYSPRLERKLYKGVARQDEQPRP